MSVNKIPPIQSEIGTFETCSRTLRMSPYWGRPEVTGARSERRDWTQGGDRAGGRTAHRYDRIFLMRELYIKGGFWQASAERRLAAVATRHGCACPRAGKSGAQLASG